MSFLTPLFFLGVLAVAGPLIFHLIRRTTRERTIFSSVRFLVSTPPRLSRKSRLEDILLLILRCLAIALLAFGFSRPFFRDTSPVTAAPAQTRRELILVDRSASMRREGLWDQARARVADELRSIGPGDAVALYVYSSQPEALVNFEEWQAAPVSARSGLLTGRLAETAPDWGSTHLGRALVAAADALADTSGTPQDEASIRQIVLISDLQSGSELDSLQSFDWPRGIQLRIETLKPGHVTNAGLQLLADATESSADAGTSVRVRVNNAADSGREQFQVGWIRPGTSDFAGPAVDVYVPPGQSRVVSVPVPEGVGGLDQISLRGDDEPFDNTIHAVPPEAQHVPIAYLGRDLPTDTEQPLFFLQTLLKANENPRLTFDLSVDPPDSVSAGTLDSARMIFMTDAPSAEVAAELRQQMQAGKTVLFAPKSAAAAPALAQLAGVSDVPLEDVVLGSGSRTGNNYAMLVPTNFQHPLFLPFADPRYSDFTKIAVWKYRRLAPDALPGARILARFDRGDPAIVELPVGSGRLLLFLTGWNPADSNLAVSSRFVVLLYSAMDLAGAIPDQAVQFMVGDPIPLDLVATSGGPVTVTPPGGKATALPAGSTEYRETGQPGVYVLQAGQRTARVSVNLDASESRTSPLAADTLERFGAPGPEPVADPARTARKATLMRGEEAEGRQKLWRWFIVATLVVLLGESAYAGWTARRNSATQIEGAGTP